MNDSPLLVFIRELPAILAAIGSVIAAIYAGKAHTKAGEALEQGQANGAATRDLAVAVNGINEERNRLTGEVKKAEGVVEGRAEEAGAEEKRKASG